MSNHYPFGAPTSSIDSSADYWNLDVPKEKSMPAPDASNPVSPNMELIGSTLKLIESCLSVVIVLLGEELYPATWILNPPKNSPQS